MKLDKDTKLKMVLAHKLSNDIDTIPAVHEVIDGVRIPVSYVFMWRYAHKQTAVLEDQWLSICHSIESIFWDDLELSAKYCEILDHICCPDRESVSSFIGTAYTGWIAHASWKQRAKALIKLDNYVANKKTHVCKFVEIPNSVDYLEACECGEWRI